MLGGLFAGSSSSATARRSMEPLLGEKQQLYPARPSSPDEPRQSGYHSALPARKLLPLLGVVTALSVLAFVLAKDQVQQPLRLLSSSSKAQKTPHSIRLKTVEEPYLAVRDPQRRYTWSSEAFLPAGKLDTHEHTIAIHPRQAKLDDLPDTVNPEEIVFGFTTPYKRAREMSMTWSHFLRHGSQCLIMLPREEEPYRREMEFYLSKEGLDHCQVATVDLGQYQRYEHRVLNMPRAMSERTWTNSKGEQVTPKWYVVVDDDSQVLDMRLLQREMASRPHQENHMMCAITESVTQLGRHGKICYGGGGILMSAGLVNKMKEKMWDCFWLHHWRFGGDEMLTHCAATAAGVSPDKVFENIDGLHRTFQDVFLHSQLTSTSSTEVDIPGDGSGVFQSGLSFITLHHYTGWLEVFPLWFCPDRMEAMRRLQKAADWLGGDNL